MKLHDLDKGEQFIFNHRKYTLLRKLPRYEDVYDCMDDGQRHRPFKGTAEVEPLQKRIGGN